MKTIVIAGRLGRDAELRRTQGGDPVLSFPVAVDDGYGERKSTMWFDCSVWGKRAEALSSHLVKGMAVAVSGDLGKREHDGKTYLTVRVSELTMQGGGERQDAKPKGGGMYDRDDPRTARQRNDDLDNDSIPI
jgi:single-strand DNA-binding protein